MPQQEWVILMGVGGLFVLLGVGAILWGKAEEKSYFRAIGTRPDVREFLEHSPRRPEAGALKTGGRIAITLGLLMMAAGSVIWFMGLRI